jgi:hypothetical protein
MTKEAARVDRLKTVK